jgi:hypothetical protein
MNIKQTPTTENPAGSPKVKQIEPPYKRSDYMRDLEKVVKKKAREQTEKSLQETP